MRRIARLLGAAVTLAAGLGLATPGESTVPAAAPAAPRLSVPPDGRIPVAVVITRGAEVVDFSGPWGVFEYVSLPGRDDSPFQLYTVAESTAPLTVSGGMTIVPAYTFENAPAPKVIVVPALGGAASDAVIAWLKKAAPAAELTMSVCNGSFALAKAGLLAGKPATAHHWFYKRLAASYPEVTVKRGARFVDAGSVSTAGGLTSGIDLALHVVERYFGRTVAEKTALALEYQGTGWKNADSNVAFAKPPVSTPEHPVCQVCEMDVTPPAALKSIHNERTYQFCSEACKKRFDAAPERFIGD